MKRNVFILLSVVCFSACKKSSVEGPAPAPGVLVPGVSKVKTSAYGSGATTYTYDAQGRQLEASRSDGSKTVYEYLPGKINRKIYNTAGVYLYSYIYELNADGLCKRETRSNNPDYEELIQFNADKTIAKSVSHINGVTNTIDYFYSNGNCDSMRFIGDNGNWSSTIVKTYYTDKPNVLNDAITGDDFFCKANKNLQKYEVYEYPNGTTGISGSFTYEYDAAGRVIKRVGNYGNSIEVELYTYY